MKFIYEEKQKRHLLEFSILNGKFMHMNVACVGFIFHTNHQNDRKLYFN